MLPDLQLLFNDEQSTSAWHALEPLYPTSKPLSAISTTAAQHMGMA
jgi:hypothetical protein